MGNNYKIIKDPAYGYLRVDPVPSQEEVERYYREEFYSTEYKRFNDSSLEIQKEEQEFFDSRWESIHLACLKHFGRTNELSVFDIGFGYAQALIYFHRKGMKVSGLEPSPEGVAYARSKGLTVFQAGIEDFACVGDNRYDVVTVLNVLEHLRNPSETLINIRKSLLNPGGLLVIDVPNEFNDFQLAANAAFGLKEWWVCPPVHINYFSSSSLSSLAERCGYRVVQREASFPLELFLLMGDVYIGNAELGRACHQKRVKFESLLRKHGKADKLSRFYQALATLDLGRQTTLYATY